MRPYFTIVGFFGSMIGYAYFFSWFENLLIFFVWIDLGTVMFMAYFCYAWCCGISISSISFTISTFFSVFRFLNI